MNKILKAKKLLIVVDMINGFIREGALADSHIESIIGENVKLIKEFIDEEQPVIAFKDAHTTESTEFQSFPLHCIQNSSESELIDEIKQFEEDIIIFEKNSTSGMFAKGFIEYLNSLKELEQVVITGCCTDICITNLAIPMKNFFNQNNLQIDVIVPQNAVDTFDAPAHKREEYTEMAFKLMKQAGIKIHD